MVTGHADDKIQLKKCSRKCGEWGFNGIKTRDLSGSVVVVILLGVPIHKVLLGWCTEEKVLYVSILVKYNTSKEIKERFSSWL